jgi:ATP-dependent DNA helicase RecG
MMAPTEILADQHHQKISQYLQASKVRWILLRGGLGPAERKQALQQIADGHVDLVIGTHALIQQDVRFARLGLVVVDEQHRFGVLQRALIRGKGLQPHYLVMTATPIPRTLALTVFGDLDVSIIDELPPGRQPVQTQLIRAEQIDQAYRFVRSRLACGEQAYVVYPLLEESQELALPAAAAEVQRLRHEVFADWDVGLLHGQMKPAQKQRVMSAFASGRMSVLVATTVVEVGIDVPNATVMMVQHAERFGLSQLHQLRGRIGRGARPSYCLLVAGSQSEPGWRRLAVLVQTDDGFRIAEEDLRLRGPGEVVGLRQHGLPELKVADLLRDLPLPEAARDDARRIAEADERLARAEHAPLRTALIRRFGEKISLIDVG